MFAAYANLQLWSCSSSALDRDADQFTHSVTIQDCKRIMLQNPVLEIYRQKFVGVITRESESSLGEVV